MLIIFVNKFMKKVFIVFIIRNFCQENGRTHLALYFENEGIFISKISQIGSIPCQVYLMEIVYPCGINVFIINNQLLFFALLQTSYCRTIALIVVPLGKMTR